MTGVQTCALPISSACLVAPLSRTSPGWSPPRLQCCGCVCQGPASPERRDAPCLVPGSFLGFSLCGCRPWGLWSHPSLWPLSQALPSLCSRHRLQTSQQLLKLLWVLTGGAHTGLRSVGHPQVQVTARECKGKEKREKHWPVKRTSRLQPKRSRSGWGWGLSHGFPPLSG